MAKDKLSPMFANMTKSDIPKSPREKAMWIAARRIVAKQVGLHETGTQDKGSTEKAQARKMPWGLVTKIYLNAKKANKVPKQADWKKAKVSTTVKAYVKPDMPTSKSSHAKRMSQLRDKYRRAA